MVVDDRPSASHSLRKTFEEKWVDCHDIIINVFLKKRQLLLLLWFVLLLFSHGTVSKNGLKLGKRIAGDAGKLKVVEVVCREGT